MRLLLVSITGMRGFYINCITVEDISNDSTCFLGVDIPGVSSANDLGREFITGFMQNTNSTRGEDSLKLIITTFSGPTFVSIKITNSQVQWTVYLQQGQTQVVSVPQSSEMIGSARFPSSILINSDNDISVVSVNEKPLSVGSAALLPVPQLGTKYYVVTPTGKQKCSYKEFAVINYGFRNKIIINFKCRVMFTGEVFSPNKKLTITLEPYQALQLQSEDDMSGTMLISEKPIAVLSGHSCVGQDNMCDHAYEQLPPLSNWGKVFLVPPLKAKPNSDFAYVVAARWNTYVTYISGQAKYRKKLGSGEVFVIEVKPSTPISISASAVIQVLYYHTGDMTQPLEHGSFIISLKDTSTFCTSYSVYGLVNFDNSAAIVAKTSATSEITLDNQPLSNIHWTQILGSQYSWGLTTLGNTLTSHIVEHPNTAFALLSFGNAYQRAYGTSTICTQGMCGKRSRKIQGVHMFEEVMEGENRNVSFTDPLAV
ncbi:hypothetical protein NDU88_010651 [Pleurodeles waltl]|uniref:IgGFc-binding protein N-terminal domain-containing protein n=1 Tax=Pleurodeles waltl TaxID=8319 RepID=A0AAV7PW57_PLEWA|nr:hypothetical protein NDU88_010651 [Pleurodeles waltl]